ncbi:MAG: DHHW family protein, partial [Peptostreptococcus anaerobius]
YDVSKLSTKDPYQVFTGGNHTQIRIRTNIDTERKLLVIKDSYANAMLPFLVNNFSEINVVDMRYFTGSIKDLMNNAEVTDVLILGNINTFNTDASILSLNE